MMSRGVINLSAAAIGATVAFIGLAYEKNEKSKKKQQEQQEDNTENENIIEEVAPETEVKEEEKINETPLEKVEGEIIEPSKQEEKPEEEKEAISVIVTPSETFDDDLEIIDLINKINSGICPTTQVEAHESEILIPLVLFWSGRIKFEQLFKFLNTDEDRLYANIVSIGIMGFPLSKNFGNVDTIENVCNIDILFKIVSILKNGFKSDLLLDDIFTSVLKLYQEFCERCKVDKYYKLRQSVYEPILSTGNNIYSTKLQIFGRNTYYKLERIFQDDLPPLNHQFAPSDREGVVNLFWNDENGRNYSVKIDPDGSIEGAGCPELFANWADDQMNQDQILVPVKDLDKDILNKILHTQLLTKEEKDKFLAQKVVNAEINRSIDFYGLQGPSKEVYEGLKPIFNLIYSLNIQAMISNAGFNPSGLFDIKDVRFRLKSCNWKLHNFTLVSDDKVRMQLEEFDNQIIVRGLIIKVVDSTVSVYINGHILNLQYKQEIL